MEDDINLSSDIRPDKSEQRNSTDEHVIERNVDMSYRDNSSSLLKDDDRCSELSVIAKGIKQIAIKPCSSDAKDANEFHDVIGDEAIICGECSVAVHFKCSKLPAYQIHRFLTARNYRKYVCENCCSVPKYFTLKWNTNVTSSIKSTNNEELQKKLSDLK